RRRLSADCIDILIASLADNTLSQYNSSLRLWWNFCLEKKQDRFVIKINDLLQFLTRLYKKGEDPIINRFLKGVARIRPMNTRYASTWGINIVLKPLSKLNFQELTERTVILLALGTASRAQTLVTIDIYNIKETKEGLEIRILERTKTYKAGKARPLLCLPFFKERPDLCIANTVIQYLTVTANLRDRNSKHLFIAINKPHKEVFSQTISRWIKTVLPFLLQKCGIDINVFLAQRGIILSCFCGLDLETIGNAAG
ncbi:hypothetical protein ALC57_18121, partial [Trachymyrmex cornetzi]